MFRQYYIIINKLGIIANVDHAAIDRVGRDYRIIANRYNALRIETCCII